MRVSEFLNCQNQVALHWQTDVKLQLFFSNNTYVLLRTVGRGAPSLTATTPAASTHVPLAFSWLQGPLRP